MLYLRFWRPSLNGRVAAKHVVTSVGVLALLVGLLTTSGQVNRFSSASVRMPQPSLTGQPPSTTVQTLVHTSSVPRFDTFARGYDWNLWHKWWQNGVWHDWEDLEIPIDSAPTAVAFGGGIQVFYLGGYGEIWQVVMSVTANTTTIVAQNDLGGAPTDLFDSSCDDFGHFCSQTPFTSAPAVTSMNDGRMDVFALAKDQHHLLHRWWTNDITGCSFFCDDSNGWSDWELLSVANFAGDPAAVSWGGGIDVFVHGSDDNHVYIKVFDAGSGHWIDGWGDLGGTILYSPAAASWGPGRVDLYAIGTDHQMWTKWYSNGQWSGAGTSWNGWAPLGGYFNSSPAAGSLGPGALDLVGLGGDWQPYHSWWGGQWSPWDYIGSPTTYFTSAPAVVDSWVSA